MNAPRNSQSGHLARLHRIGHSVECIAGDERQGEGLAPFVAA